MSSIQPIPETVQAVAQLEALGEARHLLEDLRELTAQAKEIVPDLVGVSIASLSQGVTFTLLASAQDVAVFDAVQYLAGGPCVEAAHTDQIEEFYPCEALDEDRWCLFAQATAARGVRSTLTLPVLSDGRVVGTVNLYAASRRAFVGHRAELAEPFGAWAEGAVANADLSFTTRREAEQAPTKLRNQALIDQAVGIVAEQLGVDVTTAAARLREAATRAGVTLLQLAGQLVRARQGRQEGSD
jgi:GAF domain-containing protein